jgi:hypothetical protein
MPTNNRILSCNRLPDPVCGDTLKSGILSDCGNRYGQAFCVQYGLGHVHPVEKKINSHEALWLVFKRDGVHPQIAVDNLKEQMLSKFAKKCLERTVTCVLPSHIPHEYRRRKVASIRQRLDLHGRC